MSGRLTCVRDATAAEFARYAWDHLAGDPVRNNVFCTLLETAYQQERPDWEWYRVLDDELCGVAMRTPPRGLLVSALPEAGARVLARHLAGTHPSLPSVSGPSAAAGAFARQYAALRGVTPRTGMAQRLYRLDRVVPPGAVPGGARPAVPTDRDLILDWLVAFGAEALTGGAPRDDQVAGVDSRFTHGDLMWLWEVRGVPVSFAWRSPVRPPGAWPRTPVTRISAVYTPPEHRGRGYASANVAAISQRGLQAGAVACMLYTNVANPVSNKIYERIGYRPVDDAQEWLLS
jgi:RimJ/RimL family protein N-acetyltransferase